MKRLAILALIATLLSACNKHDEPKIVMPPATTVGKNTLGCYVNSTLFVCSGRPTSLDPNGVTAGMGTGHASIRGTNYLGNHIFIKVYDSTFVTDVSYTDLIGFSGATAYDPKQGEYLVLPDDPFNYVKFSRFDDVVVAGTFQFKAYNGNGDSVVVTQGRFDIAREQ